MLNAVHKKLIKEWIKFYNFTQPHVTINAR